MFLIGCTQQESTITKSTIAINTGSGTTQNVIIENFSFTPKDIIINAGTTVTWVNKDPANHELLGGEIQSPAISTGQTYSHTFDTKGKIDYYCSIHPSMKGSITVE